MRKAVQLSDLHTKGLLSDWFSSMTLANGYLVVFFMECCTTRLFIMMLLETALFFILVFHG